MKWTVSIEVEYQHEWDNILQIMTAMKLFNGVILDEKAGKIHIAFDNAVTLARFVSVVGGIISTEE